MPKGSSFFLKTFVCATPVGILLFNEIKRITNVRENESFNKSLFLKNFDRNILIKNKRTTVLEEEKMYENKKRVSFFRNSSNINKESDKEEALNYFYGKAWGYTTDYEIDISLNTGDLIFIKHDLDNLNIFKKILLKVNRYFQGNNDYDEIGMILKKNNISYIYIQNLLNKKENVIRYSYFLQKYKPSVVSLRRFLCDDENIKIELQKNIMHSIMNDDGINKRYSIFLNLLYNIFKKKVSINTNENTRKNFYNDEYICKKINSNIEINNLINMLLFRSFNLFYYFINYMKNVQNVQLIKKKNYIILNNIYLNSNMQPNKNFNINDKKNLQSYEFPRNSLTHFNFIKKDYELMKKNQIIYEKPKKEILKEIEKFFSFLIENEYTLMDSTQYVNQVLKNKRNIKVTNNTNHNNTNKFIKNLYFYINKFYSKLKSFSLINYHVYEIYRKTHLLPFIKKDYNSISLFLSLNNFYKPINSNNILQDTFNVPKLSNIFHVRQEEAEKLQKYFYQFNKVPKSEI
ncbi:conserved Plasmodium protein, unknown function [Plasmodium sp. DRC-Itaito]|nr:conserved Plasmodium protein, unknown function [Plasmodium sp. DRC-Itaito]